MARIYEFLEGLNSHSIYDADALAKDFKDSTGCDPCWPVHTATETARRMAQRGLGGHININEEKKCAYGWEIAEALATKYLPKYECAMEGRGSRFWEAQKALKQANA